MSIQVDLPAHEIADLIALTKTPNASAAVVLATREFMRMIHLRELKGAAGKIEFFDNWHALEAKELREPSLPEIED